MVRSMTGGSRPLDLDVLVIGGGIQGLWLLNDLKAAGYAAALLERRTLGGGQTLHSHIYIHRGYLYREKELIGHLSGVTERWTRWIRRHKPPQAAGPSYFGFEDPSQADRKLELWSSTGLEFEKPLEGNRMPRALRGGVIRSVYKTPEIGLMGESLISLLNGEVEPCITRIQEVERVSVTRDGRRVDEIEVSTASGPVTFRPRALVLAAGAGNQALLDLMTSGAHRMLGRVQGAQQIRKAHMLVLKGPLEPLTGVFDTGSLFMVARKAADGEMVWLISDNRSESLFFVEDWLEYDPTWWLPLVISSLRRIAPRQLDSFDSLRWGVYAAPKAEGAARGGLPSEERIESYGVENLWTVWPTKLTLAPLVSETVLGRIRQQGVRPAGWARAVDDLAPIRTPVECATELWRRTPLMPWSEFRQCHDLPEEQDF